MLFICEGCGRTVFYLDSDCPFCGREIAEEQEQEESSEPQMDLLESSDIQLRLFEC